MSRRAIVVEDQPDVRNGLALLLSSALGYSVAPEDRCATYEEGCAAIARLPSPALLVVDVILPSVGKANGADLAWIVRSIPALADVRVVVISGVLPENHPDVRHAVDAGAVFVSKPFSVQRLIEAIERAGGADAPPCLIPTALAG